MHRSVTDLSIDLDMDEEIFAYAGASELHRLSAKVREFSLKFLESKLVMVLVLNDNRVIVYEGMQGFKAQGKERFRFKLVQSQVLRKVIEVPTEQQILEKRDPVIYSQEPNHMFVLDRQNPF